MADVSLSFSVSVVPAIAETATRIGIPSPVLSVIPSLDGVAVSGILIHQSTFDINVDATLSSEVSVVPAIAAGVNAINVVPPAGEVSVIPSIAGTALAYRLIHQSIFDVCSQIPVLFEVVSEVAPISIIAVPVVAFDVQVTPVIEAADPGAGVTVSPFTVSVNPVLDVDVLKKPGVKFGSLKFLFATRKGEDRITPLTDDRYIEAGVSTPRAYTRTINVVAFSRTASEYAALLALINKSQTLYIDDVPYDYAVIKSISDKKYKPAVDLWEWNIEFIAYVFDEDIIVILDGITLPDLVSIGDEKKTPILDDRLTKTGITEPIAFSVSRSIEFADKSGTYANAIENRVGKSITVSIDGVSKTDYKIDSITAAQPQGGGDVRIYTISLQRFQYNTPDTAVFAGVTLPNVHVVGDIKKTPINDERLVKEGISEPKAYSATVTIQCVAETKAAYDAIVAKQGISGALTLNGVSKSTVARITDISTASPRGNAAIYLYSISFIWYSFASTDAVTFAGVTLPNVQNVSELETTVTASDVPASAAFSIYNTYAVIQNTVTVECIAETKAAYDAVIAVTGIKQTLSMNGGGGSRAAQISRVSAAQPRGGGAIYLFTVQFIWETGDLPVIAVFAGQTLPNCTRAAPDQVTPVYPAGVTGASIILTTMAPSVKRIWSLDCVAESKTVYNAIAALTAVKSALTINGESYPSGVYISNLSAIQPRGSGLLWKFSVELTYDSSGKPVDVTFGTLTLPNATMTNPEEFEILTSRTTLQSGKVAVDIGTIPIRSFMFSCLTNNAAYYDVLYGLIATKAALVVDGKTIPKAYISQLSGMREVGDGDVRLYSWAISFSEETA